MTTRVTIRSACIGLSILMKFRHIICTYCLCVSATTVAKADVFVTVGNISVSPGATAYLPVYIQSDVGDFLASTNFEFRITTGGPTRLEFSNSPSPAFDPTFSDSEYIFVGNSLDETFDLSLGTASLSVVPNDTFIGGDATADLSDVTIPSSNLLLAELPITTSTALPPVAGDTFTISIIPISGSDFIGNTGFADSSGQFASFSSVSGTVTIVPEPSPWLLAVLGAGTFISWRWRGFPGGFFRLEVRRSNKHAAR